MDKAATNNLLVIDPGVDGGYCFVDRISRRFELRKMTDREGAVDHVRNWNGGPAKWATHKPAALIEEVHASPIQSPSSAFKFGGNYHGWLWFLTSYGIPIYTIKPQVWQKPWAKRLADARAAAPNPESAKRAHKNELKQIAEGAASGMMDVVGRITLNTCDALLMARYADVTLSTHGEVKGAKLL